MTEIIEIQPKTIPDTIDLADCPTISMFLAGTIEMGNSIDWQDKFVSDLKKIAETKDKNDMRNILVYNPRRDDGFTDDPEDMEYQVNWELDHLESCDMIIMNILPDSKSPISLMELGLFARSGKLTVICPKEFYRYDNVRIVCKRYGVQLLDKIEDLNLSWS